jgi:hypothetical protein
MRRAYHSGLVVNPNGIDVELGMRKTTRVRREQNDQRRKHALAKRQSLRTRLERRL